jgi:hypothetical protein
VVMVVCDEEPSRAECQHVVGRPDGRMSG